MYVCKLYMGLFVVNAQTCKDMKYIPFLIFKANQQLFCICL